MNLSIKDRFVFTLSMVTLTVTLTLSIILISLSRSDLRGLSEGSVEVMFNNYQAQAESNLISIADRLGESLINPLYLDDYTEISEYLEIFQGDERLSGTILLDPEGRIFADGSGFFHNLGEPSNLTEEQLETLALGETILEADTKEIIVYRPIQIGNEVLGIICISADIANTYAAYQEAENQIRTASIERVRFYSIVSISTLLLLLLASYYVASRLSAVLYEPILKLREHAIALGKGNEQGLTKLDRNDEIGELANAVYSMANELEMQNQSVKFLAFHDPLTGLLNRSGFQTRMEQSIEELQKNDQSGALLFIDLDDFKEVNDSLGHETGDRALGAIGDRLRKVLASIEPEVHIKHLARIGGDEFTLFVAPLNNSAQMSVLAEEILTALSSPVILEKERIHTSASIGLVTYPEDGKTSSSLLKNADTAMYTSKHLGKGTYRFYETEMNAVRFRSSTIKAEFQKALSSDNQLELLFQPIINMTTDATAAAEALIRWEHPRMGYLSPEQFIAIVEHNEIALPTDLWVLNKSLKMLESLEKKDICDISISVNISASNLVRKQFPTAVRKLIKDKERLARNIKLEITETFLHNDDDQVRETMKTLQGMGFNIWLDDFGTGYSSLRHLKDFPVDGIKIDQIFIGNLMESDNDRNMVTALISLSKAFSVEVVAEGIDNENSLAMLKKWGVKYGQGMVIGKPISAPKFINNLSEVIS